MSEKPNLPPVVDAVIEMGIVRMRVGVGTSAADSYRPRMCLCVDHSSGMILHFEMTEPQDSYVPLMIESLDGVVQMMHGLPRQIQMRNVQLAMELRAVLANTGIDVVVRESLPMLDMAVEGMADFKALVGAKRDPALLDVKGMTLDHVIAFAEAAKTFYEAEPWNHLIDDDLIQIESPQGPPGIGFTQVLGAGGETYGLGFVASRQVHEDIRNGEGIPRGGLWNLLFGDIDALPFDDGEMWERDGLPLADSEAYPSFMHISKSKGGEHPTPEQLTWAEGLLRALAATTEADLDAGRWEKQVDTFGGKAIYKLSLPLLLEQMQKNDNSEALAKLPSRERAQALLAKAQEARGRWQLRLARQAAAADPESVDALTLLAMLSHGKEALSLFERAVDAAARALGPQAFKEDVGHFWGLMETRPYMSAREMLAKYLIATGKEDEAIIHLKDMLRLNPGDNQGIRYVLAQSLVSVNQLDALDELLNRPDYKDDDGVEWLYTRALLEFTRHGDSVLARQLLNTAMTGNSHLAPLLLGRKELPLTMPDFFAIGSEEEAMMAYKEVADGWLNSPGAMEWLESVDKAERRGKKGTKEKKGKKGRKN